MLKWKANKKLIKCFAAEGAGPEAANIVLVSVLQPSCISVSFAWQLPPLILAYKPLN